MNQMGQMDPSMLAAMGPMPGVQGQQELNNNKQEH